MYPLPRTSHQIATILEESVIIYAAIMCMCMCMYVCIPYINHDM